MTRNLKSIQGYLDRRQARRDTVRSAARKWSVMIVTGNAAGMIAVGRYLAEQVALSALEDYQRVTLAVGALAFAIALVPSIMGAVALGMAPKDRSIMEGLRSEARELSRNLMIGGIGFIIGLASIIGTIVGYALSVILRSP